MSEPLLNPYDVNYIVEGKNAWSQTSAPTYMSWNSIASSSSGQYLAVSTYDNYGFSAGGQIFTSSDYGNTLSPQTNGLPLITDPSDNSLWVSICSSSSGQYLALVNLVNGLYLSNDYGSSWTQNTNYPPPTTKFTLNLTMSSSGQYLAAMVTDSQNLPKEAYVTTSSDYGVTWSSLTDTSQITETLSASSGMTSSSNGQYLVLVGNGGYVTTSSNYGTSWSSPESLFTDASYNFVASSSNGKYVFTAMTYLLDSPYENQIFVSSNYGASWTSTFSYSNNSFFTGISASSTGQYVAACSFGGGIYTSNNYGSSWTQQQNTGDLGWHSLAFSASGQYLVACASTYIPPSGIISPGGIYTYSIDMDIGNIYGSMIEELQLAENQNTNANP